MLAIEFLLAVATTNLETFPYPTLTFLIRLNEYAQAGTREIGIIYVHSFGSLLLSLVLIRY